MTTNYERIKSMTVEEMATIFQDINICDMCKNGSCYESCNDGIIKWLESESEE